MALSFVDETDALPDLSVILYGPPGVGKTTAAGSAPGPLLWLNAEPPSRMRFARKHHAGKDIREVRVDATNARATLREALLYLRDRVDGVRTCVVDTSGEVYAALVDEMAGGKMPQIQDYGEASTTLRRFYRHVAKLPGITLVILAHEEYVEQSTGGLILMPACGGKKLPQQASALVDYVGYCGVVPPSEDGKTPARYVAQLAPGHGRYAKTSASLGAARDLDLTEWITAIAEAEEASAERKAA